MGLHCELEDSGGVCEAGYFAEVGAAGVAGWGGEDGVVEDVDGFAAQVHVDALIDDGELLQGSDVEEVLVVLTDVVEAQG